MQCRSVAVCGVLVLLFGHLSSGSPGLGAEKAADKRPADAVAGQAVDPAGTPQTATISGTVVDPAGKPAAGAKIWLCRTEFARESQVLETAVADAAGRFVLRSPPQDGKLSGWLTLAARDTRGRLGGIPVPPPDDPAGQTLRIEVLDLGDHRGRLEDAMGRPIANVAIRPMRSTGVSPDRPTERHPFVIPPELARKIDARTADDGSFVLRGLPLRGDVMVEIVAPQFGSPWIFWELSKPVTMRLDPAGSVVGSLTGPDAVSTAGVRVRLFKVWSRDEVYSGYSVHLKQETRTDKDGNFRFPAVPPRTYRVRAEFEEQSPYATGDSPAVKVKPGEQAKVVLEVCRLITVRGRVIDRETKAGVAGVGLQFCTLKGDPDIDLIRETKTDARGEYSVRVLPGRVCGYVNACPDKYSKPDAGPGLRRDPLTKDANWPVIELERAANVGGVVVDESGRPAAEAEVWFFRTSPSLQAETAKCDRAGKFVLKQLPKTGTISLHARTDSAATVDPLVVALGESQTPLRLVVSRTKAGALRGELVDEAGQPIQQAYVWLTGYWMVGATRIRSQLVTARSDARGQFKICGLWPGEYQLQIAAPGTETPHRNTKVQQGQMIDFGRIVVPQDANRAIEGTVVDSAAKPLLGVRVFNSGDASQRVSTRTDGAGRFRLQGLRTGAAYVFVQQPGYHFQAVPAQSGTSGLTIRLLRRGETLPPRSASQRLSEEQGHELAKTLLDKFWATGERANMDQALMAMALLDPAKARQWAAARGPEIQGLLRNMAALRAAETDLDEALGLLPPDSSRGVMILQELARRHVTDDPAKALRCAEEGIVRARGLSQPQRAEALASFGALVTRLGRQETGRKLVEEAAQMVAALPATPTTFRPRGKVAKAVAAFDLKRAVDLLEPIPDRNQRNAWLPAVVAAASVSQPEQSRALWKKLDEPFYLNRARLLTACRLAETRPEEALQIVESIAGNGSTRDKVEALGWIATAIGGRDKQRAFAIVDRALELAMEPPTSSALPYHHQLPAVAALVAVHAQRIGYPHLQSVADRVLATRLSLSETGTPDRALESSLAMAVILAVADPETAGQLLRMLEPQAAQLDSSANRRTKAQWFQAWALADPKHAVELAERQWAAGSKSPGWDIASSGVLEVPFVLSLPRAERLEYLDHSLVAASPDE